MFGALSESGKNSVVAAYYSDLSLAIGYICVELDWFQLKIDTECFRKNCHEQNVKAN